MKILINQSGGQIYTQEFRYNQSSQLNLNDGGFKMIANVADPNFDNNDDRYLAIKMIVQFMDEGEWI